MLDAVRRIVFALSGGAVAAALVASVEAGVAVAGAGSHPPAYRALYLADLGVIVPLALALSLLVAFASLFLEPDGARWVGDHLDDVRSGPLLHRTRSAALAPLVVLGALGWCVGVANIGRAMFAQGAALTAGVTLAAAAMAMAGLVAVLVLFLVRPLRRVLAFGAQAFPLLVDPVATGAFATGLALGIIALGVVFGDTGGGGQGLLAIFGVLKRSELDLRPLINLVAVAIGSYLTLVAFASRGSGLRVLVAFLIVGASVLITVREARALNSDDGVGRAVARGAPLGKIALAALRQATDRDHDGASAWFGGGDCDDRDPRRSPQAVDIPDNGVDEDCSGDDLHLPKRTAAPAPTAVSPAASAQDAAPAAPRLRLPPDLNTIVITVDTLRTDLGFMGYPKDTSPNLDALAKRSVVFDRMYALASYTGKSIGPLFIGKYPSETKRDGGHFNTYYSANTFLAERLKDAGVHTLGAASHWYFEPWSGLVQGIETWDLRAMPPDGQGDNDTSVTSKDLSDAAIRLLKKPENTSKRFFMWLHYFDPHEQYMPHDGAPDFGPSASPKAAYDAEVWFTDKHIGRVLDFIASQPWGEKTAIVVTADHGEAFGEHNMRWHGYELWEPLVHVPFVMYVPGTTPHRVPVKRSHVDLVPTVLDLMSVWRPAVGELSGESMLDDIVAAPGKPLAERDVYIDMPAGPFTGMRHALIHGPTPGMKLIHLDSGQFQLFDLATDPEEKEDLSGDKAKLDEMVELFREKRGSLKEIEVKPITPPP